MKKMILLLLIGGISMGYAKSRFIISGKIVQTDNTPLSFAYISLFNITDSLLVNGAIANAQGEYQITNVKQGKYYAKFSSLGYKSEQTDIIVVAEPNKIVDLSVQKLKSADVRLDAVTVTGSKKTAVQKIDRKVFSTVDMSTSKAGTAFDVIEKMPSIIVSPDGSGFTYRGTSSMRIFVNGKPTLIDPVALLKQISASDITNIELITMPGAKYESQGSGGIINIRVKKSAIRGDRLSVDVMGGGGLWQGQKYPNLYTANSVMINGDKPWTQSLDPMRYATGLSWTHQDEKFGYNIGGKYSSRNVRGERHGVVLIYDDRNNKYYHMNGGGLRPEWHIFANVNGGMRYNFTPDDLLEMNLYYGFQSEGRDALYTYHNYYTPTADNLSHLPDLDESAYSSQSNYESLYNPNHGDRRGTFRTAALNYNHNGKDGSKIEAHFMYEQSDLSTVINNKRDYDTYIDTANQLDKTPLKGYIIGIDYALPIAAKQKLEVGAQTNILSQKSSFTYDSMSTRKANTWGSYYSNNFSDAVHADLQQNVYAGYISYTGKFNKLTVNAGFRIEYTDQVMNVDNIELYKDVLPHSQEDRYTYQQPDYFPALNIGYDISDKQQFNIAYGRRINRPATKGMLPFVYLTHYEVVTVGDPALKPEYITNMEVNFTQKGKNKDITLSAFYRLTENAVFKVNNPTMPLNNKLVRIYTNGGNGESIGGELISNISVNKWRAMLGGSVYNYTLKTDVLNHKAKNAAIQWSLKGNTSYKWSQMEIIADYFLNSEVITAQGGKDYIQMLNCSVNYTPKRFNDWTITLRGENLLNSNYDNHWTKWEEGGKLQFYQWTQYYRSGTVFELVVSWSMNHLKDKLKKDDSKFGKKQF